MSKPSFGKAVLKGAAKNAGKRIAMGFIRGVVAFLTGNASEVFFIGKDVADAACSGRDLLDAISDSNELRNDGQDALRDELKKI
jgi:hypothetical protein